MTSHASFWEAVKGALHSLRGSKLRSFLTLLGIILATTTLIAVMSVISGMDVYIAQNVSSMGADGYRVQRIVMMGWDPKKYLEMIDRLSKSSALRTAEAAAGWFERQKVNCPAGADVVAAVPAGPTITQEAYIPRSEAPLSPPLPDRRVTDRSRPFQRDRRHQGRRHTNGRPHSGGRR